MGTTCMSICFVVYIIVSLIIHIAEVVLNTMYAVNMYYDSTKQTWFTIMAGLMLLPMVTVQLVSALLLLQKRGEQLQTCRTFFIAVLHIFQLGFVWRHLRLLTEDEIKWKKRDLADLCLLRLFYTFSASIHIFGMQLFMILYYNADGWLTYSASCVTLFAISWALASFRRQHETENTENIILTWPGTLFRLMWRSGEIVSRMLSLVVFATIYKTWIFLVIGLHWSTMMVCICTSVLGFLEISGINRCNRMFLSLLIAFMYIFCHVNFSNQRTQMRYITYYTIMFMENVVLTVVWYLNVTNMDKFKVHVVVFIMCGAFFIGIVSMAIYYRFFHISTAQLTAENKDGVCVKDGCINCRLSLCAKHSKLLQRPFSSGWLSQYQKALYDGHYYKHLMQDSLIDSMSEWEALSSSSDSMSEGGEVGNKNENIKKAGTRAISFQATGTYSHQRFIETTKGFNADDNDTDSSSSISGTRSHLSTSSSSDESYTSELSLDLPRRVVTSSGSSQTHLLTDSWDKLYGLDNKGYESSDKGHPVYAFRPISAQSLEDWYSDGYSTDHTGAYQLPITVLAKTGGCRVSVASDSTECTMCKTLKYFRLQRKYSRASSSQISKPEKICEELEDHNKQVSNVIDQKIDSPRSSAWYNCSESGDSAFPQENVSSSNLETTLDDEDGVSETSYELII